MTGEPATGERLGAQTWTAIVVVGLAGQVAWVIENMYLNVYVYHTITANPTVIAVMVAASAIAATVTTLLAGAWSDRLGRRRPLIAGGYLLWGITVMAFGLFGDHGSLMAVASGVFSLAAVGVIVLDCLMTMVGSAANDAAFNAWVTDSTVPTNRGRVDGVLAVFPLVAMLLVFGLLDPLTQRSQWRLFFFVVGAVTSVVGVAAWVLVVDRDVPSRQTPVLRAVLDELRPSSLRRNPALAWTLALLICVATATQVFMPYLIIYIQRFLRIDNYPLLLGVTLVVASALSVVGGRLMDRVGKERFLLPAVAVFAVGLLAMWLTRTMWSVVAAGIVAMTGMLTATAAIGAMVRDATPVDRAGAVQGLRIIAAVLIPMVVGPAIGAAVIAGAGETYTELGVTRPVPGPQVFLAAAAVLVATPVVAALRRRALDRSEGRLAQAGATTHPGHHR